MSEERVHSEVHAYLYSEQSAFFWGFGEKLGGQHFSPINAAHTETHTVKGRAEDMD